MKCQRINDADFVRLMVVREIPAYREKHPNCPEPLAVWEILNLAQKSRSTRAIADELNYLPNATTRYDSNLVGKWRRGERPIPREAESYMRAEILRCVLGKLGADLADMLGEGKLGKA